MGAITLDIGNLRQWIGRTDEATDIASAPPLAGLAATLDRDDPAPKPGDPVPPGGHWLYFLSAVRHSELGADGHPRRGGFLPPVPLPRRMFAGARLKFLKPLRVGEEIRRKSEIQDVFLKEGRSGALVFVVVRHSISGAEGLAIVQEDDIVYRGEPDPRTAAPAPRPAPEGAVWERSITPDPVMLFRFSALTFNSHRIHYDHDYATRIEGYPDLVVHGPFIAMLLLDLCRREHPRGSLVGFDFRAARPLFVGEPFTVAGIPSRDSTSVRLWAAGRKGDLATEATARFRG